MAIEMDIFGGYACRDIIRHDEKGHYQVERCISGVPITALYGTSAVIPKEKLAASSLSVYEQRMLEVQGLGKAVGLLKRSKASVLLIDLTDELLRRFWVAGEKKDVVVAAEEKYAQDIEKMFVDEKTVVTRQSPLEMKLPEIEESFKRFAKDIIFTEENPGGYKEKNIIVVEAYFTEKIIDNATAKIKDHPKGLEIKKSNEFLRQLYLMLYRYIPGCNVIKFPEFTHTSENHLRGATPLSYTEETYQYYLRVLDVLFGFDKVNSVNNIYSEQNLSNQLYTRMLNASAIYSIEGMRKEIEALKGNVNKQIEDLKKQGRPTGPSGEEVQKAIAAEQKKKEEYQKQLEKDKKLIEETKKQQEKDKKLIEEAKKKIEESKRQLEESKKQFETSKKQIEESEKQLEESKKQFEETKNQVEKTKKQTEESKKQVEETKKQNEEIKKQNEEIKKLNEEIKKQTLEAREQTEAIRKQNEISKKQLEEEKNKLADRLRQFEEDKVLIERSNKQAEEFRQQHERFKRQHEEMKRQEEEIKKLNDELQNLKDLKKIQNQEGNSELAEEKARLEKELKETKKKLSEMDEKGDSGRIHEENERLNKEYKRTKDELEKAMEANRTLHVENKYLVGVREELNRENTRLSRLVQKILLTGADKN